MSVFIDNVNDEAPNVQPVARLSKINVGVVQTVYLPIDYCEIHGPIWTWAVGDWHKDSPDFDLRNISNRRVTIKLNEPDEASYTLLGDLPEAFYPQELISDLWIWRDGVEVARLRHVGSQDNINQNNYTIDWNATSYAGLMERRLIDGETPVSLKSTDTTVVGIPIYQGTLEDTLWYLIDYGQGYRGLPPGVPPSGTPPYNTRANLPGLDLGIRKSGEWAKTGIKPISYQWFDDGTTLLDGIHRVIRTGEVDFWIDFHKRAHLRVQRGINNASTLDYGQRISSITRSFNQEAYANYVRTSGSESFYSVRFPKDPNELVGKPEGVWMTAVGKPDLINDADPFVVQDSILQAVGKANYDKLSRSLPLETPEASGNSTGNFSYTCTMAPGVWRGPEHIWVGDTVRLIVKRGRLDINHDMRVIQMEISIDQNNIETVNVTLNWANNPKDNIRNFASSVRNLNKLGRIFQ